MFIKKYKPTSPARRWEVIISNRIFRKSISKEIHKKGWGGFKNKKFLNKNYINAKTIFYKMYKVPQLQCFISRVVSINKIKTVNYFKARIMSGAGITHYIKAPSGLNLESRYPKFKLFRYGRPTGLVGDRKPIHWFNTGSICYSLRIIKHRKWSAAEAAGTFCKVLWHEPEKFRTALKLPSKNFKFVSIFSTANIGRVSNPFHNYVIYGNARASRFKKKKYISVRGVAMNPVDHPNGGRANTKQPLRNPWGHIAKKNK